MQLLKLCLSLIFIFSFNLISVAEIPYSQRRNLITMGSDSTYGFWYKGQIYVPPMYENIIPLGNNRPCFLGKYNRQWRLLDIWNRPLIQVSFEDVQVFSDHNTKSTPRKVFLDSIFVANEGTVLPQLTLSYDNRLNAFTDATPAILVVRQKNPMTNRKGWRYLTFDGNSLNDDYYEEATVFYRVSDKKHRNHIYIASVKRDNLWGAIDLNGKEIVPVKYKSPVNRKNKDLAKLLKKDHTQTDRIRIEELENLVPEEGINTQLWMEDSIPNLKIKKSGGELIKQKKTRSRSKKQKRSVQYTPVVYQIFVNDTLAINEEYEEIDASQNPMIKVKKNGKWGLYKANSGSILDCEFTTLNSFDQFGILTATSPQTGTIKFSAYGAFTCFGPDMEEIFYKANQTYRDTKNIETTGPCFEELLEGLQYYDDPFLRTQYQTTEMVNYFNLKREKEDPVYAKYMASIREQKRMEEEKALQEKQKAQEQKKNSGGFWGMLGDLATIAGEVLDTTGSITGNAGTSSTGSSLSYLGKTVSAVARGEEMPQNTAASTESPQINNTAESRSVTTTMGNTDIQQQIASLDDRIKTNREQAAALVKKRNGAEFNLQKDLVTSIPRTKGTNLAKNNMYATARRRAKGREKASVGSRNALGSIDTQIEKLNREWSQLISQRAALVKNMEGEDDGNDYASTSSNKKKTKEQYQSEYDSEAELAKMYYTSLKNTGNTYTKKDGKDYSATNDISNHNSEFKAKLVRHQIRMKQIRETAAIHKFILTKSEYETVKVALH